MSAIVPSTGHKSAPEARAVVVPASPSAHSWFSAFARRSSTDEPDDGDQAAALFMGASLFHSPLPKEIRFAVAAASSSAGRRGATTTTAPLLASCSPLSGAEDSCSREDGAAEAASDDDEATQAASSTSTKAWRSIRRRSRRLLSRVAPSRSGVAALFCLNLLWSLSQVRLPVPVRVVAPAPAHVVDVLLEEGRFPGDTDGGTDAVVSVRDLVRARADIERLVRRGDWRPKQLLAMAVQQAVAGQAILERVQTEYEALLAELDQEARLCRLPFAHVLNPACPAAAFDAEAFVSGMALS